MWNVYGRWYFLKTCYSEGWMWWDNTKVEFKERVVRDCWGDPVQGPLSRCVITLRRINTYFVRFAIHLYIMITNSFFFVVDVINMLVIKLATTPKLFRYSRAKWNACLRQKCSWFTTSTKETNTFICLARTRGCYFLTRTEAAWN